METVLDDLIGVCYVVVKEDIPNPPDVWLAMSHRHFYVKYRFPSLIVKPEPESWASKRRMRWGDIAICPTCMKQEIKKFNGMKEFSEKKAPLRVFDPFGGTGAFGLAMEEVGCFKLTHAVEISPSAATTLRYVLMFWTVEVVWNVIVRNNASAGIKVYNQCSNLVLRHAILTHENKNPEPLKSIEGHVLPPPPKPGDIDCIVAGFPW